MKLDKIGPEPDLLGDPFLERSAIRLRGPLAVLGSRIVFESNSEALLRLVDVAYARLPRQRLPPAAQELRVRLFLTSGQRRRRGNEPPPLQMFSGAGLIGGATVPTNLVVVNARQRAALVVVGPEMLAFPYHTRYELIEFAVYALVARVRQWVALHAACVGVKGRGVLLMGASGAGKSTVTLQSLLHGLEFLSEDSVLVAPRTLLASGVANFLHVGPDSLRWVPPRFAALFRKSPVIRRRSGVRKFAVDLRRGDQRLAAPPLKIGAVVFLSKQASAGEPLLTALSAKETRDRLRASQPYAAGQPGWSTFTRNVSELGAFELRRGRHPSEAVEALRSFF
jgi:energy-coupling factor transporter ATP-binding protein EcfA2